MYIWDQVADKEGKNGIQFGHFLSQNELIPLAKMWILCSADLIADIFQIQPNSPGNGNGSGLSHWILNNLGSNILNLN